MGDYQTLQREVGAAPDAGNAAIAARFAAGLGPAGVTASAEAGAAEHGGGGSGGGKVSPDDVWPVFMPPQSTAAASGVDPVDWGPPTGWAWRITEMSIVFGAGCTLVQVYRESASGAASLRFQTGVSGLWEPSRLILLSGQRLVAVSVGGGATIAPEGERVATGFLPTYLA